MQIAKITDIQIKALTIEHEIIFFIFHTLVVSLKNMEKDQYNFSKEVIVFTNICKDNIYSEIAQIYN